MSPKTFEHKDELDCEVTVFEGAHSTCDEIEGKYPKKREAKKENSSKGRNIKDDYNI